MLAKMLNDLDEELAVDLWIGKVGVREAGNQVKHLAACSFEIFEDFGIRHPFRPGDDGIVKVIHVHRGMIVVRVGLVMADNLDAHPPLGSQMSEQRFEGWVTLFEEEFLLFTF